MMELAEQVLGIRVRKGSVIGVGGLAEQVSSPVFATSTGLVLYQARLHCDEQEHPERKGLFRSIAGKVRDIFG